jgi:hypothetical protein
MVVCIKYEEEMGQNMIMLVCRDAFPKEYVPEARTLAQKGMTLTRDGEIASFRVVARGIGCIPVLELKCQEAAG